MENIKVLCRSCMCKAQTFYVIDDMADCGMKICDMMATATPQLTIRDDDKLPRIICSVCFNKLSISLNFQQMCIDTDRKLRALLKKANSDDTKLNIKLDQNDDSTDMELLIPLERKSLIEGETNENSQDNILLINSAVNDHLEIQMIDLNSMHAMSDSQDDSDSVDISIVREDAGDESSNHNIKEEFSNERSSNKKLKRLAFYECQKCSKRFDRPYALRRHLEVHSSERPHQCDKCGYRFSKTHKCAPRCDDDQSPDDGKNLYHCSECKKNFENEESFNGHKKNHTTHLSLRVFNCNFCPESYEKLYLFASHVKSHPEFKGYKCNRCDRVYVLEEQLQNHLQKHESEKPYICEYCNKTYLGSSSLKEHLRTHTNERPYLCPHCGKTFKNNSNMRQHVLRHSNKKSYECPKCPSKFLCHSDRNKHLATHSSLKPHVCDICQSRFTRSDSLVKHKYIHTGERPHKCDQCSMTFVFSSHLLRHKRTHSGEKPHECSHCGKAFLASGDLTKHLRLHVGEKTYACSQCPEAFKYQKELREHDIAAHYAAQKTSQS